MNPHQTSKKQEIDPSIVPQPSPTRGGFLLPEEPAFPTLPFMDCVAEPTSPVPAIPGRQVPHSTPDQKHNDRSPKRQLFLVGSYILDSGQVLGSGGYATVYLARHRDPNLRDIQVAIKILDPKNQDAEWYRRALLEVRIGGSLKHPALLPVLDCGELPSKRFGKIVYITTRLFRGDTWERHFMHKSSPYSIRGNQDLLLQSKRNARFMRGMCDVCDAIQYAHDRGIVHRDIKPSNIAFDFSVGAPPREDRSRKTPRTWVLDFGLAGFAGSYEQPGVVPASAPNWASSSGRITRSDIVVGTPHYTAPERVTNSRLGFDPRSDVWALGVMTYQILTGRFPFADKLTSPADIQIAICDPSVMCRPIRDLNPYVTRKMERVIHSALLREHTERTQSVGLFKQQLLDAYIEAVH